MVNGLLHCHVAAPVAPCLFICQRLPLCHAPLQRKSLHGPPQRQSLHVDIQFIVSACRSCSTSLAVAPVASRTWSPYSSSRSIHMHHVIMHQRCRYMSVVSTWSLSLHERCRYMSVVATFIVATWSLSLHERCRYMCLHCLSVVA